MKVAVVMGGPSQEHDVSLRSGAAVMEGFKKTKHNADQVVISKDGIWQFGEKNLPLGQALEHLKRFEVVFIALHGAFGEDGTLQALLDLHGIPYTGSSAVATLIAMNKAVSDDLYVAHGLSVPKSKVFFYEDGADYRSQIVQEFSLPLIVKPVNQGSSVGVTVVHETNDIEAATHHAFLFDQQILVQEFVSGQEFSCGVLDDSKGKRALPPTAIRPTGHEFFTYEEKYSENGAEEITPAPVPDELIRKIQDIAARAHEFLGCRHYSRTDTILGEDGVLYVIETNTLPGLTKGSLLPKQLAAADIPFEDFLDNMVQAAVEK